MTCALTSLALQKKNMEMKVHDTIINCLTENVITFFLMAFTANDVMETTIWLYCSDRLLFCKISAKLTFFPQTMRVFGEKSLN